MCVCVCVCVCVCECVMCVCVMCMCVMCMCVLAGEGGGRGKQGICNSERKRPRERTLQPYYLTPCCRLMLQKPKTGAFHVCVCTHLLTAYSRSALTDPAVSSWAVCAHTFDSLSIHSERPRSIKLGCVFDSLSIRSERLCSTKGSRTRSVLCSLREAVMFSKTARKGAFIL